MRSKEKSDESRWNVAIKRRTTFNPVNFIKCNLTTHFPFPNTSHNCNCCRNMNVEKKNSWDQIKQKNFCFGFMNYGEQLHQSIWIQSCCLKFIIITSQSDARRRYIIYAKKPSSAAFDGVASRHTDTQNLLTMKPGVLHDTSRTEIRGFSFTHLRWSC